MQDIIPKTYLAIPNMCVTFPGSNRSKTRLLVNFKKKVRKQRSWNLNHGIVYLGGEGEEEM